MAEPEQDLLATIYGADSTEQSSSVAAAQPDAFDPERFRVSQDFAALAATTKKNGPVFVTKPSPEVWFRSHHEWEFQAQLLEVKHLGEPYLVSGDILPELIGESALKPRLLVPFVTRQGQVAIWPIGLPDPSGNWHMYHRTAYEAMNDSRERWVRMKANRKGGFYEIQYPEEDLGPVNWPDTTFPELLERAFADRLVDTTNHPVVRELKGYL